MLKPNLQSMLSMKSLTDDKSDFSSREVVDNFLVSYFSLLSDKNYPALEIGVYEGASACYLAGALQMQERKSVLMDNLKFLKSDDEVRVFVKDVIGANLSKAEVSESSYDVLVADSLHHNWANQKFSFFHIDAHNPAKDIETALSISSEKSIIVIDDFLIVPYHLEVTIKAIMAGKVFPFAIGTKKIFMTNNKEMALEIHNMTSCWNDLSEVMRVEEFEFFGHPIHKVYSSKKYHQKMYNYFTK